jgi:antitoxin component YwqK of YwqJK toxin-antitoxin module
MRRVWKLMYKFIISVSLLAFYVILAFPNIANSKKSTSSLDPFTIVLLPDTQFYNELQAGSRTHIFDSQTQWIASHVNDLNIKLVLHLGDIVEQSRESLYKNAHESFSYLDGIVPYVVTIGNHDIFWVKLPRPHLINNVDHRELFHKNFPLKKFQAMSSFGDVFQDNSLQFSIGETSKREIENSYHFFNLGGVEYMVLALEHRPKDNILAWANKIAEKFKEKQIILLTHEYVEKKDTLADPYGQDIWEKFARKHKNIRFVFSGHAKNPGKLIGKGDHGNSTFQIGTNYQFDENGGDGFLRLLKFYPKQKKIMVETFSPLLNQYKTDEKSRFSIDLEKNIFSKKRIEKKIKKPKGKIKKLSENGNPLGEWNYKNGRLEGETKLFHPNGKLKMVENFSNNLPTSLSTYYENGQLNFQGSFTKGILNGNVKKFYDNGQLKFSEPLTNAKFNGLKKVFYPNGNLQEEKIFDGSTAKGPVKLYYPSGKLRETFNLKEWCISHFDWCTQKIDGQWKEYYENGNLKANITYVSGYEHGIAKFYSEKGLIIEKTNYYRNKTHGTVKKYFKNGNPHLILSADLGIIKGPFLEFYQDGGIRSISFLRGKNINGPAYQFNSQGELIGELTYVDGKREGSATSYDQLGGKTIFLYANDKMNGTAKKYDSNDKLIEKQVFENNILKKIITVK